jgi:hypothetical protein
VIQIAWYIGFLVRCYWDGRNGNMSPYARRKATA